MTQPIPSNWRIPNANDDYTRYQVELEGWGIILRIEDISNDPLSNASLIASAPELLQALEAIESALANGSLTFIRKRQADSDTYHPANVLMTHTLTRVRGE